MNILIIGCGKVGSRLADVLCQLGHDVAIIAQKRESFDLLSDDFSGFTIQGVPIDLDILRQAGIEGCDAIAAVTEDDNTNIMVCQIAREIFNVPRIVARIFDPLREDIFSRFDIQSVCPTNITVSSVYAMLTKRTQTRHITVGNEVMSVSTMEPPRELVGLTVEEAARQLQPESLIALVDQTGEISMTVDLLLDPNHFRTIRATDKLLVSTDIR
ncbi:MAG: TrkA family potassium uptake protein [Negativibacillus sp.]|nr:TrkA family potassium uptake protein [Negativibacillus sp.]